MDRKTFLKGVLGVIGGALVPTSKLANVKADKSKWKMLLIAGVDEQGRTHIEFVNNTDGNAAVSLTGLQHAFQKGPIDYAGGGCRGKEKAFVRLGGNTEWEQVSG